MSKIIIDQERCKQCGACAKVCSSGIIMLNGKGSYPAIAAADEMRCINCGHCEAACPEGCLKVTYSYQAAAARHAGEWNLAPERLGLYMRGRRSIRHFQQKLIERGTFDELLDIARFAPSAGNGQPVRWVVVQDPGEVRRLTQVAMDWLRALPVDAPERSMFPMEMSTWLLSAWDQGVDTVCRDAPHLVIAHAAPGSMMPLVDGTIALTYLDLAAPSFGLGACWAGFFYMFLQVSPQLRGAVGIPPKNIPLGAMMLGYPKYEYHRIPERKQAHITWKASEAIGMQL